MSDEIEDIIMQERELSRLCRDAIENTAASLGVDPAAFAEACQDGVLLSRSLKLNALASRHWDEKLAALKRAEPQS